MSARHLRAFALLLVCVLAGFGGYEIARPHAAYATCSGPNCLTATPPCAGPNCLAPCETHPCVVDLVTDAEANLPDALPKAHLGGRGLIPGPDIIQVTPSPGAAIAGTPFALKIDFKPHPGEPVDKNSVKVIYEKNPEIDLTPKLKQYISVNGISVPATALPAGHHTITVIVSDTDSHVEAQDVDITVSKH